jgi:hypothetical protein
VRPSAAVPKRCTIVLHAPMTLVGRCFMRWGVVWWPAIPSATNEEPHVDVTVEGVLVDRACGSRGVTPAAVIMIATLRNGASRQSRSEWAIHSSHHGCEVADAHESGYNTTRFRTHQSGMSSVRPQLPGL